MPNPYDLLSQKLEDDPDDQLRLQIGQDQGGNLAGGPEAKPDGQPDLSAAPGAQPMAPSANVPGPLAALAAKPAKPRIKLKNTSPPPKVKKIKPRIKLKSTPGPSSALQNFIASIGVRNNG